MTPEQQQALEQIENAADAAALFAGGEPADIFKRLQVLTHPDRFKPAERKRAEQAVWKLSGFYTSFQKLEAIQPKIGKWTVAKSPSFSGDVADLYLAESNGQHAILKKGRSQADNDLMDAEVAALRATTAAAHYLPSVLAALEADGCRVNVLSDHTDHLSLSQIGGLLSGGIPFRHIVWMANRALSLLGFVHRSNYIHGGVLPDHLLYHAQSHGLRLVGWTSAVTIASGRYTPYLAKGREHFYPAEVARQEARNAFGGHPATDTYMLMRSLKAYAQDVPARFQPLFDWALAESPTARPVDAWEFQERFMAAAEEEYGPPKFVELVIPKN